MDEQEVGDVMAELEASMPNICTRADVPNIFSALDANKNGKIELREFSEWFIAGSLRPVAKQVRVCHCCRKNKTTKEEEREGGQKNRALFYPSLTVLSFSVKAIHILLTNYPCS